MVFYRYFRAISLSFSTSENSSLGSFLQICFNWTRIRIKKAAVSGTALKKQMNTDPQKINASGSTLHYEEVFRKTKATWLTVLLDTRCFLEIRIRHSCKIIILRLSLLICTYRYCTGARRYVTETSKNDCWLIFSNSSKIKSLSESFLLAWSFHWSQYLAGDLVTLSFKIEKKVNNKQHHSTYFKDN